MSADKLDGGVKSAIKEIFVVTVGCDDKLAFLRPHLVKNKGCGVRRGLVSASDSSGIHLKKLVSLSHRDERFERHFSVFRATRVK